MLDLAHNCNNESSIFDQDITNEELPDILSVIEALWIGTNEPEALNICFEFLNNFKEELPKETTFFTSSYNDRYEIILLIQALNYFIHNIAHEIEQQLVREIPSHDYLIYFLELSGTALDILRSFWNYIDSYTVLRKCLEYRDLLEQNSSSLIDIDDLLTLDNTTFAQKLYAISSQFRDISEFEQACGLADNFNNDLQSSNNAIKPNQDSVSSFIFSIWKEYISSVDLCLYVAIFMLNCCYDWKRFKDQDEKTAPTGFDVHELALAIFKISRMCNRILFQYSTVILKVCRDECSWNGNISFNTLMKQQYSKIYEALRTISKAIIPGLLQNCIEPNNSCEAISLFQTKHMLTNEGFKHITGWIELCTLLFQVTLPVQIDASYWMAARSLLLCGAFPVFFVCVNNIELFKVDPSVTEAVIGGFCLIYKIIMNSLPAHEDFVRRNQVSPLSKILFSNNQDSLGIKLWLTCGFYSNQCSSTSQTNSENFLTEGNYLAEALISLLAYTFQNYTAPDSLLAQLIQLTHPQGPALLWKLSAPKTGT